LTGSAAAVTSDLYYRVGVENYATTTNSEEIVHFMARTKEDLFGAAAPAP